jgi:hypothetical protein
MPHGDKLVVMWLRWIVVVVLTVTWWARPAAAQTEELRHDAGATVTWLNLNGLDQTAGGLGGRVGIHVIDLLWLDAEANVFPTDDPRTGRKLQAFAGAKLGSRSRLFGLFGKVRPGGIRFTGDFMPPGRVCIAIFPTPPACLASRRALALDYGSVIEVYPSDRTILRFDLGTTYIWYGSQGEAPRVRTGNFQFSAGVARRF